MSIFSSDGSGLLLFGIIFSIVVGLLIAKYILQKAPKRMRALEAAAINIGFRFDGLDWMDRHSAPQLSTALFHAGYGRRSYNIMTGLSSGLQTSLFDYQFATGGDESSTCHFQTVAAFRKEGFRLPNFEMRPEGVLQKIGDAFTRKDIHFESHPEFSRRYQLRGDPPEEVRQLFSANLLSYLEGLDRKKKWRLEASDQTLIVYRADVTVKPADLPNFLQDTSAIASSFFSLCTPRNPVSTRI